MSKKRIFIFKMIIVLFFIVLIVRVGQLQLYMGEYYYSLSEENRISERPIAAPRGRILDRNSNILVSNRLSYDLYILPNEIPEGITAHLLIDKISTLTALNKEFLMENYSQGDIDGSSAIILKRNISTEDMVVIKENYDDLPGILVNESSIRDYVYGNLAPHLFGYLGEIGVEDLRDLRKAGYNYSGGDIVGITGLEKEYETYLNGIDGIEQVEVNSHREQVKVLGIKPPVQGNDLVLNIDFELQEYTENLLQENFLYLREIAETDPNLHTPTGAAAIVMNPNTGEILTLCSIPGYNLNDFAEGLSLSKYNDLMNDPLDPLVNRPIRATVPPGSIFKLVTGTAAIEYLGIDADTIFNDRTAKFYIPNWSRPYKNWKRYAEGKVRFTDAIASSNNIIFYQLGYRLYQEYHGEKLSDTARYYGLGKKTGIDLPGEKSGLVPDEAWKRQRHNEGWYPGDSVNLSIGQGSLLTTPLQLIDMVSAIANGGTLYKPYLVDKIVDSDGNIVIDYKPVINSNLPFKKDTFRILREGMIKGANSNRGTSSRIFRDFPVKIAGKTGTAQTGTSRPNHGFFAGFAPAETPEIAVLVFLENGNSSAYTLPIAADIFEYYFGIPVEEEEEIIEDSSF
ncbi:penicillin-binding protein 2 [Halocella sp. SP3-1]|uniref:penicillin-binding protein 2 n=1 Tax=Halocella sp. SP3-1 TaxID=2382161 RepID=UPI000F75B89E|nr:penicillin-binding protein 2 [Halocella sp. SP3-1]AZO94310.1 penicillin-binding protein 2 [Halocella sp. SP3-1]